MEVLKVESFKLDKDYRLLDVESNENHSKVNRASISTNQTVAEVPRTKIKKERDELDVDDMLETRIKSSPANNPSDSHQVRIKSSPISQSRSMAYRECDECFENTDKHRVIYKNDLIFILISHQKPLVKHEFTIRNISHFQSFAYSNAEFIDKVTEYKRQLCSIFEAKKMNLIFVEYHFKMKSKGKEHFNIKCFPMAANRWDGQTGIKTFLRKGIAKLKTADEVQKYMIDLKDNEKPIYEIIPREVSYFLINFGTYPPVNSQCDYSLLLLILPFNHQ